MGYVNNWKYFLQSDLGINLGNYEEAMVQDTDAQGTGAQVEREPDGPKQNIHQLNLKRKQKLGFRQPKCLTPTLASLGE